MAITAADCVLWQRLRESRQIPARPRVLEIGEANWYGDIPLATLASAIPEPFRVELQACVDAQDLFGVAKVFYRAALDYQSIDAIDLHGTERAWKYDLNEPLPADIGTYDIVINTGTVEHVFDIAQAFRTIHDCCAVGGIMHHGFPFRGWVDHGFWAVNPTLLVDLAAANDYEMLSAALFGDQRLVMMFDPPADIARHLAAGLLPAEAMLYVTWRKRTDAPFRKPRQGRYTEEGASPLNRWRDVPGWLATDEGRILQELATGKDVLEIGSFLGRSTCAMGLTCRHLTAVDWHRGDEAVGDQDTYPAFCANLQRCGVAEKVTPLVMSSQEAAPILPRQAFDLVFVDGAHTCEQVTFDTKLALECVRPGGVIAWHDMVEDGPRSAVEGLGLPYERRAASLGIYRHG